MAYKIKSKKQKFTSEADVFNEIESRIRKGKPVSDREIRLLAEGYEAYNIPIKDRVKLPY